MWTDENPKRYARTGLRYPSDITDDEFNVIEPLLPLEGKVSRRALVDAIFYVLTTGCQWRQLPRDFPPRSTTHDYFVELNCTGVLTQIHGSPGYDAGKKIKGRKRHAAVDKLGLLINIAITPADVRDRDMIAPLMAIARRRFPSLKKVIADGGYRGKATADDVQADAGIPLEIVKRSDAAEGFVLLPKRWIVERTYGCFGRCRRLAKDFEHLTRSHVGFVILAMIRLMSRRIVSRQATT